MPSVARFPDRPDAGPLTNPRSHRDGHVVQVSIETVQTMPVFEHDETPQPSMRADLDDRSAAKGAHRTAELRRQIDPSMETASAAGREKVSVPFRILPDDQRPGIDRCYCPMPIEGWQLHGDNGEPAT